VINLSNSHASRNRNRLPNPDPLLMDYAARTIERRYNVSPGMAKIVAELVTASIEARQ
jgi:hypothetical protein